MIIFKAFTCLIISSSLLISSFSFDTNLIKNNIDEKVLKKKKSKFSEETISEKPLSFSPKKASSREEATHDPKYEKYLEQKSEKKVQELKYNIAARNRKARDKVKNKLNQFLKL